MKTFIFYLSILWCCFIAAQEPVSIHLNEKDGLPDKEFYGLLEDSKGFIWLGGNDGLTRFDGKNFKTYSHPEKRGRSVFQVVVDSRDRVWCINLSGQLFYVENDKMILFKDYKKELGGHLPKLIVHSDRLVISSFLFTHIYASNLDLIYNKIYGKLNFFIDPAIIDGQLFVSHDDDLVLFDEGLNDQVRVGITDDIVRIAREFSGKYTLLQFKDQILLLGQNVKREKFILARKNKQWNEIKLPEILVKVRNVIMLSVKDRLYFTSSNGVLEGVFENDEIKIANDFLRDTFVTDIIVDRDGNYWNSTLDDGIFIIPNLNIKTINTPDVSSMPTVIRKGKGNDLLIGYANGNATAYNIKDKTFTFIDTNNEREVTEILYDSLNNEYKVFKIVNQSSCDANTYKKLERKTINLGVVKRATMISKDSLIYSESSSNGIASRNNIEIDSTTVRPYFRKRGYTNVYHPKTGNHYFGLVDELVMVDKNSSHTIIKDLNGDDILTESMTFDSKDNLWIATFSNGIYKAVEGNILSQLSEKTGLLSNNIGRIHADGNYLWITTDQGIQKYDINNKTFQNLQKQDGIPSYSVTSIVAFDDDIYFCTKGDGVFSVKKDGVFKEFESINLYITSVQINEQDVPVTDSYEIQQSESAFSVQFNSTGYRSFTAGSYEYRLLGFDDGWKKVAPNSDRIQYASLPLGNFEFQLRGVNNSDDKQLVKKINVEVSAPFYKSAWFILLVAGVVIAGIVVYYRWKLRFRESEKIKALEQLQQDRELTQLKLENLRSQMNPHFVFNALNSIQDYIVRNHKTLASDYLGKFADLISTYLEHSSTSKISLAEEIQTLEMYLELEKLRFEDKLHYDINVDPALDTQSVMMPTMLIQPYAENALKHGLLHRKTDRRLTIEFNLCQTTDLLVCTVRDNGVGRKHAQEINERNRHKKKSFATNATENRLQLLNYGNSKKIGVTINDLENNGAAAGTEIVIHIPFETN